MLYVVFLVYYYSYLKLTFNQFLTLDVMSTKINFISSQRLYKFDLIILSYNQYYT